MAETKMDKSTLRELARELREKGLVPPFFLMVTQEQYEIICSFSGYVPVREYDTLLPRDAIIGKCFREVGAYTGFRLLMDRRKVAVNKEQAMFERAFPNTAGLWDETLNNGYGGYRGAMVDAYWMGWATRAKMERSEYNRRSGDIKAVTQPFDRYRKYKVQKG